MYRRSDHLLVDVGLVRAAIVGEMRSLQLVVVAAFAFSLLQTGVSQYDGEKLD